MLCHSAISARGICGLLASSSETTPLYVLKLACTYQATVGLISAYDPLLDLHATYEPARDFRAGWEG